MRASMAIRASMRRATTSSEAHVVRTRHGAMRAMNARAFVVNEREGDGEGGEARVASARDGGDSWRGKARRGGGRRGISPRANTGVGQCRDWAHVRTSAFARGRAYVRASASAGQRGTTEGYPELRVVANGRVVAIGDLHGDIGQARRALRIAGVLDDDDDHVNPKWIGGNATLVQVGDILDRGDDEIGILILLQKLGKEAKKVGGAVYVMNGNHEILNISGDFRYVSRGAFGETMRFSEHLVKLFGDKFRDAFGVDEDDAWTRQSKARLGLFSPGGPLAQQLSMNHTILIVNDTVFAHGGLVPRHVDFGLDKLNRAVSDWMRGKEIEDDETRMALGMAIGGVRDSVVWHRAYGTEKFQTNEDRASSCQLLDETLSKIQGVKRLVVGHTPQIGGANCECSGKIWRIDVGMSFGVLGADPQVLEINGDDVKVLTSANIRATTRA